MGSVYDAMNFGNGYENVYTATPDVTADGVTTPGTVTDTLVTPFGNINLDSLFGNINDANTLDPGDALTGLQAGDSAIGADAFSIGGTTFDPTLAGGAEGFTPVEQLLGAPPLLDLGGGTPTISVSRCRWRRRTSTSTTAPQQPTRSAASPPTTR